MVHPTKLFNSDWSRAVQLIPSWQEICTCGRVRLGEKAKKTELAILWNYFLAQFCKIPDKLQIARPHTIRSFVE